MRNRKHVRILKAHRNSDVYVDGRYLHVNAKISTQSKRGREIARETAQAILAEVGGSEGALEVIETVSESRPTAGIGGNPSRS